MRSGLSVEDLGGFNLWVEASNAKARHLQRDPRATIVVAESEASLRGVEVRGTAQFIDQDVTRMARRIVARYIGDDDAVTDTDALQGADVIIRIEPGHLRVWDFADEYDDWRATSLRSLGHPLAAAGSDRWLRCVATVLVG